ncbi:MAG TPA: RcpC/CpaB family pilus assembly protein [Acidimicrobiia bacterium]
MVAVPIGDEGGVRASARRGLAARLSSGHVLMIAAGLLGAVLGFAALHSEPAGVEVAVAAREIRGGESVRRSDFGTARVQAPQRLLRTFVRPRELGGLRGRVATSTVEAGELIVRREFQPRAARDGLRSMSIPIDPARAVGGRLAVGDRIDVLDASDHTVSIIVRDAEVLAVDAQGRGGIGATSTPFTVTIAVDASQSQLLAAAIADGDMSIARTTGAASSQGTAPQPVDRGSITNTSAP